MRRELSFLFLVLILLLSLAFTCGASELQEEVTCQRIMLVDSFGVHLILFVVIIAGLFTSKHSLLAVQELHTREEHHTKTKSFHAITMIIWKALEVVVPFILFWMGVACVIQNVRLYSSSFKVAADDYLLHSTMKNGIRLYSVMEICQYGCITNAIIHVITFFYVFFSK